MPSQLFGTSEEGERQRLKLASHYAYIGSFMYSDYHMESITGKDFKKPEDNY